MSDMLTIAIPKGRLQKKIGEYFSRVGITIEEISRRLDYIDEDNNIRFLFVKNSDVPVYVNYGVADIGISGSDVIYQSNFSFLRLGILPFGQTRICLAGYEKDRVKYDLYGDDRMFVEELRIATKFTRFTKDIFIEKGIPVTIIKLTGSVELAPILGLADFIVDLVETGTTLKENNLSVIEDLGKTEVEVIANPGLYKLQYKKIDSLMEKIRSIEDIGDDK